MEIRDLLKQHGVKMATISRRFGIPYRTVQNWCLDPGVENYRECPEYVVRMMDELLRHDEELKNSK